MNQEDLDKIRVEVWREAYRDYLGSGGKVTDAVYAANYVLDSFDERFKATGQCAYECSMCLHYMMGNGNCITCDKGNNWTPKKTNIETFICANCDDLITKARCSGCCKGDQHRPATRFTGYPAVDDLIKDYNDRARNNLDTTDAKTPEQAEKSCSNCKLEADTVGIEPCFSCMNRSAWTPKS
jgi:hypothetical protein